MPELVTIRRALISVSDKADLVPFARALRERGVEIVSTGGTAKALAAAGIEVLPVEKVTGFPEGLDGRVKTLHPAVHGGLLAVRDNAEHAAFLKTHNITPIDLVCINLYPFEETVSKAGVSLNEAIENIDVGGPAMIRGAAKNYQWVTVVPSPQYYDRIISEMDANGGATTLRTRAELATAAFGKTAEYDASISTFLGRRTPGAFPQVLKISYTKVDELRYGENPHQEAALYRDPSSIGPTVVNAKQLHGKELSYNNILDAAAALEAVRSLGKIAATPALSNFPACAVVVKHTNPCGAAMAANLARAVDRAIAGDPIAAYGGILATNQLIDLAAAKVIANEKNFFEVIVAPEFDGAALGILRERWANVRLLAVGEHAASVARKLEYRSVPGGMVVQDRDVAPSEPTRWEKKAGPDAPRDLHAAAIAMETLVKYVSSNAVVIGGVDTTAGPASETSPCIRLFGVGSGQVDRVSACRLAAAKAGTNARGAAAAGDAFFPFPDGPAVLIEAGVKMIVHPGGSKRDQETIDLCQRHGVTCLVTGMRHFRH
jgi:phosphoribosylaminoimidazolecarboxamide formyltransferase/IMP cyclohydrolase